MSKPRQQGPHGTPEFIDILSPEDRKLYEELQQNVGSPDFRYNRNRRLSTLRDLLDCIKDYCERNDQERWKRYLVCGICWFDNGIAINTRQLRLLISKSKSAINGAFAKMGYQTVPTKGDEASQLVDKIPFLSGRYAELRQWTIRKMNPFVDKSQFSFLSSNKTEVEKKTPQVVEIKAIKDEKSKDLIDENDDFDLFDNDPFSNYNYFNDYCKNGSEKDQEFCFVNFCDDAYDTNNDFHFDFSDSNVFTLRVISFPQLNLSDVKKAMKGYHSDEIKEYQYSKEFKDFY